MAGMICIGPGRGVQPLLGYCAGAKNQKRYRSDIRFSLIWPHTDIRAFRAGAYPSLWS